MHQKKLRILQLAPRFPFPADDGGKIGIGNILKEFSNQGAEVTFFSYYDNDRNKVTKEALEYGIKFTDVKLFEHSTKNTALRIFKSIIYNHSVYIEKHINIKIKDYISQLIKEKEFDIVHADHSCMANLALFVKNISGIPAGLRLHNIEWMIWKRYADNIKKNKLKQIYIELQAFYLRKEEKKIYSEMDVCFPITEPDKNRAIEIAPEGRYIVASAGVNTDEWIPSEKIQKNPFELILATTYQWRHNIDAVKWFIEKVLPELRKIIPEITLTLIGKEQPEWLSDNSISGVKSLGYVDKVQPYLNNASIYIAPLFVGSGIRIKILEAMAMELPVVATTIASEGINAKPEDGFILCEDKESYINSIMSLIKNPTYSNSIGKNARKFVMNEFSWQKNVQIMLNEYKRLAKFDN
ncbi:MAG: glycosyltransferase [Ignavibacteriae bacterium]|nr:glycosyltransferase [Ignavibacteriota bacterium]